MPLGSNRDYTTAERRVRRSIAVTKARTAELVEAGMDPAQAKDRAFAELVMGELTGRLNAWVDPILEHKRAMKAARKNS